MSGPEASLLSSSHSDDECCLLSGDDVDSCSVTSPENDVFANLSGDESNESGPPRKRARRADGGDCASDDSNAILADGTSEDNILGGGLSPLDDADVPSSLAHKLRRMRPFQWASGVLECLVHLLGYCDFKGSLLVDNPTLSTHFSGIGTAEKAARCLEAVCAHESKGTGVGG